MIRKETYEYYRENTDIEIFKNEIERMKSLGCKVLEENNDYVCLYTTVKCNHCIEVCVKCDRHLSIEEYKKHNGMCYVCRYEDYIKDLDIYNLSGIDNKILNHLGKEIGTTLNSHYAEGIVKSLYMYNQCLDTLNMLRNSINDDELKSKIDVTLEQAINL